MFERVGTINSNPTLIKNVENKAVYAYEIYTRHADGEQYLFGPVGKTTGDSHNPLNPLEGTIEVLGIFHGFVKDEKGKPIRLRYEAISDAVRDQVLHELQENGRIPKTATVQQTQKGAARQPSEGVGSEVSTK